ncbi:hypothetical protein [Kribbella sp. CA-247076]|uniref:hypothetical protein n=1 Tax=Kribbella sp. CA-247076 TaxID=3239941 RepID=UPI003D94F659
MTTNTVARIAAMLATIGIAAVPLTISAPANATTKPEPVGTAPSTPTLASTDSDATLDLAQLGAGALGGIALSGVGLAAANRLRHHRLFSHSTSTKTPTAT